MAPSPQNYGQQDKTSTSDNYDQSSQMGDDTKFGGTQQASSSYGKQMSNGGRSYGDGQSMGGGYGKSMRSRADEYGPSMGASNSGGYGQESYGGGKAEPFAFGYDIDDGYGNTQFHKENGDEQGKVTGSYGYKDAYGVMRHVDYVADENGFRATVKTNEPGTANESPADVDWHAEEPPAQTNPGSKSGSYGSGSSSSYNSADSSGSSYGMGSSSRGGNSYGGAGSSSGSSYGRSDSGDMSQYASSSMVSPNAGGRYSGSSSSDMLASGRGGSSYGTDSSPMMSMAGDSQYSPPSSLMMNTGLMNAMAKRYNAGEQNGSSGKRYGPSMGAGMGRQGGYGGNGQSKMMMMMMNGAARGSSQYGSGGAANGGSYGGSSSTMTSASGQYGMGSGTGSGNYGGNGAMTTTGKSSRYKSGPSATNARNGGSYGSDMGTDSGASQYGAMGNDMQRYGSQQVAGAFNSGTKGGSVGPMMASNLDDSSAQLQYNSDSALAQEYGPSMMLGANSNSAQQYGGQAAMDGTATYSSMRMQSASNGGLRGSGYGNNQNGAPRNGGVSGYGGNKSGGQQSNGMDLRKAAAKNIAALVKRY